MKSIYFILFLIIGSFTACVKSLPPLAEVEEGRGEIFVIFNDTGLSHLPYCGEGTDLTFELSSGNEFKEYKVPLGRSYSVAFDIEPGEKLSIAVKDSNTNKTYTTQTQVINSNVNKQYTVYSMPPQSIRVCPPNKLRFINF